MSELGTRDEFPIAYELNRKSLNASLRSTTYKNNIFHAFRRSLTQQLPDWLCIAIAYRRTLGRFPNLVKPRSFTEKVCRRRLHPQPSFSDLSDKVKVRDYVARVIGRQYLIPAYKTCQSLTLQTYHELPDSFVMKGNHGSGYNLIVKDKREYSFSDLREISNKWLKSNYYSSSRERHYKDIKPQLIFEKLLLDENGNVPKDYKFYCFRSEGNQPKVFIEVTHDRFSNFKVDYYDTEWNLVDVVEDRFTTGVKIQKPHNLDEAITQALKLSAEYSFARIDFYMMEERIYFGEITFTPTGGLKHFKTREIDETWGSFFEK
ncbi:ATP-grasp fold amidoligase family protein [Phytohalomonas tamaricis]|uniref:ATP-grasp fold amidoligase family protein n=1 Tax=Phytohalomonas tamaricis TaxID=2081032 RepID=UPI000D0AC1B7|nr:ATP-grasp fold amidoligase family protein [Phytohalomonas tamaricis]